MRSRPSTAPARTSPRPSRRSRVPASTPLELEIWWTPTHYGDLSADEYAEIKRSARGQRALQGDAESSEWDQYSEAVTTDKYPVFQLGWFPDYPDADNYLAPFYGTETGYLNNHYANADIDRLINEERASTDQATRTQAFEQIQKIAAEQTPLVPIWQGKQVAAARTGSRASPRPSTRRSSSATG